MPARKDQDGRVATQGERKRLRAFHAKIDPAVFDAGDRGSRDTAQFGQLDLAKSLKFPNDANGLTGRNTHAFPQPHRLDENLNPTETRGGLLVSLRQSLLEYAYLPGDFRDIGSARRCRRVARNEP